MTIAWPFKNIVITLGVLIVVLLPFWPYSHSWGYLPAISVAVVLGILSFLRSITPQ